MLRDQSQLVLVVETGDIEHRATLFREEGLDEDRVRNAPGRTPGSLAGDDPGIAVPDQDDIAQVGPIEKTQHVLDVGRQSHAGHIPVPGVRAGEGDGDGPVAKGAQAPGHRLPDPGSHPRAGDEHEGHSAFTPSTAPPNSALPV
jgi:hypothetical protein